MARGLKLQRSDTIGFISDNITTTPFAAGLVEGAQHGARETGKHLLIVNVEYRPERSNAAAMEEAGPPEQGKRGRGDDDDEGYPIVSTRVSEISV